MEAPKIWQMILWASTSHISPPSGLAYWYLAAKSQLQRDFSSRFISLCLFGFPVGKGHAFQRKHHAKRGWAEYHFIALVQLHFVEKAMATHSSNLAWKIPWIQEPGRLQSMGSLRVGYDGATSLSLFAFMHWRRKWQPTTVLLPGESQGRGPRGLPSMGSHRVGHNWSDLAAEAAAMLTTIPPTNVSFWKS